MSGLEITGYIILVSVWFSLVFWAAKRTWEEGGNLW